MGRHKTKQRIMAMVLSAVMVVGMMPVSAFAETSTFPIGTSGEIIAFEALGADISMHSVPLATNESDLKLPNTLTATIRLAVLDEEPVLDTGETDAKPDSADTVSGSAIGMDEIDDAEAGAEAQIASPSDAQEDGDYFEAEPTKKTVDSVTEITVSLPVTWVSSPEYNGEAAGTYIFTPELPAGLTLASSVEVPAITVVVGAATPTGTIAAFDELPDDIRWQNTTMPEFPKNVSGTVEGETAQIPVTWDTEQDYDAEAPQRGLYVFTAVLNESYTLSESVELPRMTVYIPQTAGRMMARMAGGGTTESPLEITTAAQLAEIATLVNARPNGLELFLFNNAGAKVSLKMMNDIDLSAYSKDEGWMPIGTYEQPFRGIFDGNGKTITNLTIDRIDSDDQGLFGVIGAGGTVKTLGVVNTEIEGGDCVGGVAATVYGGGSVQYCYSTGAVSGIGSVGGVAGYVMGNVENCYSAGAVSGIGSVGGMVGSAVGGSTVENCYSTCAVSGTGDFVSGVAGTVYGIVKNCAALNSSVSGTGGLGRVAGYVDGGTLSGNLAFGGMTVTQNGSAKTLVEGADQVDGEPKTAADIKAAGFFEALFGNDTVWTYATGELPGFGAAITMPTHITGTSDPNFRGAGTSEDPYQIATAAQLAKLAELVTARNPSYHSAHYKLMNDLDLSSYGVEVDGKGWSPIGRGSSNPFGGSFDGNGKTVSGLSANHGMNSCIGLFGFVTGTVENLSVVDVNLRSGGYMGGIAGYVSGTLKNCSSSGSIIGSRFNGGIAGGLTGTVENCYSTAAVSGSDENGGVVGYVYSGRIINCAALGLSVGGAPNSGRVSGATYSATLSGNIAFGGMTVNGSIVSGGTSTGKQGTPMTAAEINAEGFFEVLFVGDPAWTYEKNKLPGFGKAVSMPTHLIETGAAPFDGAGTSGSDPYLIKTAADLAKLAELVNAGTGHYAQSNAYYRLVNNLDLSAYASGDGWTPIGGASNSFKGSFDGNNKTITGLTINRPAADNIGLFGYLYIDSNVQNIRIIGTNVKGKDRVGGVAGDTWGATVENCTVTGSISGVANVGGTVGSASSGTVQDCYSSGSVTGSGNYVGGIIGYLEYAATTVQRCYSASSVSGAESVGGVAGIVGAAAVKNCYSTGNVTGSRFVGGVAGDVGNGSVQNCYSTGSVLGTEHVGGVLGYLGAGTAKNSVALNPSIVAGAYNYGRMVGNNTSGILLNNYAFSRMPGTWANKGLSAKDGADVTSQTLFGGSFWTTAENWNTSAWDSGVWTFAEGKLPTLKGLTGQNGDGGLYLTARDIQYATVGATDGLTYNGSEQVPAIIFDGETLVKDTDYIVVAADGSASDGTNAGEVTLTLTGTGSFYGTKNISYTIDPKPVTITPNAGQKKKYGEPNTELTFANDGGLAPASFDGMLARGLGEDVGTYAISLGTLSAGGNYELSLAPGTVDFTIEQAKVASISTMMANVSRTAYEMHTASTAQAVVDAVGLPSDVSVITDGGTAMLPITWSTATAYNVKSAIYVAVGTLTGNSNINPNGVIANLTVTVAPVTAVNPTFSDTLVVTNSDSSATAAELGSTILPASGNIAVEGQSIAYTINWNGGEMLDRTAVGTEQTFTGAVSYIAPPAWLTLPGDLSASRKVTVTAKTPVTISGITTPVRTYNGAAYAPSGTVTASDGFPVGQLVWLYESTDDGAYSSSTAPTNAGAYKLTILVPGSDPNYIGSETFTFTIDKREITLTADNKTVTKGSSLPTLTYRVGNLAPNETASDALSTEPTLACPTFDGNALGDYPITLSGGTAANNYTITGRTGGTFTVAEQTYTVTFVLNGGTRTGGGALTQTIAEGGAATAPIVTRNGYTFTGWDKAFTNVSSALTVTAIWSYNGGGESGDGGGSSTVPSAPSAPEKKPDQPVTATAPITAAGQNGAASASIPAKTVTDAIAKAQADAKAQGKTANGISVALNVTMPKGTTSLAATLTRNSLNSLVSAGVTELEISGAPISLSLDLNALKEIQKQSNGNISITIAPATGLSNEAKTLLGNRPVYSITISYLDKNGKTQTITSLGSGTATLSIPYTPGKNEAIGYLFGVYVNAKGKAQRIPGSAYDANSGSLLIPTGHFSVYGVGYTAPSAKFTDIGTHWGKEAIDYVVGRGLLSGTSETTFAPNTAMTRGMLVTALGRLDGVDAKAYTTNSFTDVKADSTFRPYIEWAYKNGVVQGIGNKQFAPDRAITREEIAVIFANYAKATGYKLPVTREATAYADASSIGSVYQTAVTAMQQAGIMMGGTGNKFNPKANATRAEVSSMLHRYIKLTIDPTTAQGWALNDAGQYLYYKDGKALTGTQIIDSVKYFFETTGVLKTGWVKDGDNWRYYSSNKAAMGWLDISDKRYCFTKDGLMVSGKWLEIDGKWYYFYADGALAKSTKVDGYEVDENGVRKTK